jgi:hypothetical protein
MIVSRGYGMWPMGLGSLAASRQAKSSSNVTVRHAYSPSAVVPLTPAAPPAIYTRSADLLPANAGIFGKVGHIKGVFSTTAPKKAPWMIGPVGPDDTIPINNIIKRMTPKSDVVDAAAKVAAQQAAAAPAYGTTSSALTSTGGGGGGGGGPVAPDLPLPVELSWWESLGTVGKVAVVGGGAVVAFLGYRYFAGGRSATAPKSG